MAAADSAGQHEGMDDVLAALRRWEESGGTWRIVVRRPARLELELLTCDGGEVMGRLVAAPPDPQLEGYVSRSGS
jgi:hypothetical protein